MRDIQIHPTAEINVRELTIGGGAIIGPGVVIEGRKVVIGREAWLDRGAYIGGGSCFDPTAELVVGDWLHMGRNSHINLARPVRIGHEFGCGIETKVFAHGAYLSEVDGFPVAFEGCTIGDQVWLPNAWVNPGVTIGSNVVVAARSLVNRDLPSGCLAGGIPAKVLRANCYPQMLSAPEMSAILVRIVGETQTILDTDAAWSTHQTEQGWYITCGTDEVFDITKRAIIGMATVAGQTLKNQLRRHGIRFRCEVRDGYWQPWEIA
jgi:UDP-3-O-[3-hydroxymyristoyl] glucosamine N-acyltransferase